MRHILTLFELSTPEIEHIFSIAEDLKAKHAAGIRERLFPGRVIGLLFEKPSLRTRISFEAAMTHLGGNAIYLSEDVGWGKRETVADFSRIISQYLDVLVCRSRSHSSLEEVARFCSCPVINGLTDCAHPCQALSDVFTLRELHGPLRGQTLAFVGDSNNVLRSLAVACGFLDVGLTVASPPGYELDRSFLETLAEAIPGASVNLTNDPVEAVRGAFAVYTDVWASMGQESERQQRRADFAAYQVNAKLMSHAPADAYFLHCLPAHRGDEVTDEVIDGPNSIVVEQAANRLHVQKGILAWLLESAESDKP